jgi:hypothetical protein
MQRHWQRTLWQRQRMAGPPSGPPAALTWHMQLCAISPAQGVSHMVPVPEQSIPIGLAGHAGTPASAPLPPAPASTGRQASHAKRPFGSQKQAISLRPPPHGAEQLWVPVQAAPGLQSMAPPVPPVPPPTPAAPPVPPLPP